MSQSAMPATQSGAASRATSASPDPAKRHKYHPCHAKRRWMSPSATPATQNGGGCRQVSCLPRKVARRHGATNGDQARHQTQPSVISTTPATQNGGGCRQVPRLPRETTVDVAKWMVCGWCDKDDVWVTKLCVKHVVCVRTRRRERGGGRYRSKNKNPTQFCGGKKTIVGKDSTCF